MRRGSLAAALVLLGAPSALALPAGASTDWMSSATLTCIGTAATVFAGFTLARKARIGPPGSINAIRAIVAVFFVASTIAFSLGILWLAALWVTVVIGAASGYFGFISTLPPDTSTEDDTSTGAVVVMSVLLFAVSAAIGSRPAVLLGLGVALLALAGIAHWRRARRP